MIAQDLAAPDAAEALYREIGAQGIAAESVVLVVANAGLAWTGQFAQQPLDKLCGQCCSCKVTPSFLNL